MTHVVCVISLSGEPVKIYNTDDTWSNGASIVAEARQDKAKPQARNNACKQVTEKTDLRALESSVRVYPPAQKVRERSRLRPVRGDTGIQCKSCAFLCSMLGNTVKCKEHTERPGVPSPSKHSQKPVAESTNPQPSSRQNSPELSTNPQPSSRQNSPELSTNPQPSSRQNSPELSSNPQPSNRQNSPELSSNPQPSNRQNSPELSTNPQPSSRQNSPESTNPQPHQQNKLKRTYRRLTTCKTKSKYPRTCLTCDKIILSSVAFSNHNRTCGKPKYVKKYTYVIDPVTNKKTDPWKRLFFDDVASFQQWKEKMELQTFSYFSCKAGGSTIKDKSYSYYSCQFNLPDKTHKKAGEPYRKTNMKHAKGRVPNLKCPAKIAVKQSKTGLNITFLPTHNHPLEVENVKFHPVKSSFVTKIKKLISQGVPADNIVEDLRQSDYTSQLGKVNRRYISNLKYCMGKKSQCSSETKDSCHGNEPDITADEVGLTADEVGLTADDVGGPSQPSSDESEPEGPDTKAPDITADEVGGLSQPSSDESEPEGPDTGAPDITADDVGGPSQPNVEEPSTEYTDTAAVQVPWSEVALDPAPRSTPCLPVALPVTWVPEARVSLTLTSNKVLLNPPITIGPAAPATAKVPSLISTTSKVLSAVPPLVKHASTSPLKSNNTCEIGTKSLLKRSYPFNSKSLLKLNDESKIILSAKSEHVFKDVSVVEKTTTSNFIGNFESPCKGEENPNNPEIGVPQLSPTDKKGTLTRSKSAGGSERGVAQNESLILTTKRKTLTSEESERFLCEKCSGTFKSKQSLCHHTRKCELRQAKEKQNYLPQYVQAVQPPQPVKQNLKFTTQADFQQWKEQMELETFSYFSKKSGNAVNKGKTYTYYTCQFNAPQKTHRKKGAPPCKQSRRKRVPDLACQARISTSQLREGGSLEVVFRPQHNHPLELANAKYQRIQPSVTALLEQQISRGIRPSKIVQSLDLEKQNRDGTPNKNSLLGVKHVYTVKGNLSKKLRMAKGLGSKNLNQVRAVDGDKGEI